MSDFKERMQLFSHEISAKRKEFENDAKESLSVEFKKLFEENPTLESFSWRQYTDYFNDGDECTFSAHFYDDELTINGVRGWDDYSGEDKDIIERNRLRDIISELLHCIPEFILKDIFGDHVEITVDKDGIKTTSYTNHD